MTKSARLSDLEHMNLACTQCELRTGWGGVVFGEGNADTSVVFVTDKPFTQRTGEVLHQMMEEAGFRTGDVYITTIVKCCPSRKPTLSQIQTCLPWLRKQYSILKPSFMVLLGLSAAQAILDKDIKMKQCRGQWFKRGNTMMMPIYHPEAVVRNPLRREIFVDDLRWVKEACKAVSSETVAG
jgi:DNA polymerase